VRSSVVAIVAPVAVVLAAALAVPACSSGSPGESACPNVRPTSCPSSVPSYKTDVAPILHSSCTLYCHSPTGIAGHSETTYADVYAQRSSINDQVNGCSMPPSNAAPLTTAQRSTLLAWLACDAPNN
jgi:hypothetical protein